MVSCSLLLTSVYLSHMIEKKPALISDTRSHMTWFAMIAIISFWISCEVYLSSFLLDHFKRRGWSFPLSLSIWIKFDSSSVSPCRACSCRVRYCKHSMTLMKYIWLDSIVFFAASLDISHTFLQVLERCVSESMAILWHSVFFFQETFLLSLQSSTYKTILALLTKIWNVEIRKLECFAGCRLINQGLS